jgi:hypothetical protein
LSREEYKKYFIVFRTIHFISRIDDLWLYAINQGSYCWERIVWEEADAYFGFTPSKSCQLASAALYLPHRENKDCFISW